MVGLISFCHLKERGGGSPTWAEQGCGEQRRWWEATAVVFMVNQVCLFVSHLPVTVAGPHVKGTEGKKVHSCSKPPALTSASFSSGWESLSI